MLNDMEQRTIKFRYWNGGAMVYEGMPLPDPTWILHNKMYEPYGENIIMQFTGLHDRNGKEIYEGDIVKTRPGTDKRVKFLDTIEKVEFKKGSFVVVGANQWNEVYKEIHRLEIIGNIYENPDLIK